MKVSTCQVSTHVGHATPLALYTKQAQCAAHVGNAGQCGAEAVEQPDFDGSPSTSVRVLTAEADKVIYQINITGTGSRMENAASVSVSVSAPASGGRARAIINPRPPPRPDPPTPKARTKKRARQSPPPPSPMRRPPNRKPPPRAKPSSPTTSSRSKKGTSPNVFTATSPRRPARRKQTFLTLDTLPIPPPRPVSLSSRLFGHEIQCLMHAFGEVRYCARDVLEIVEDSVRGVVLRIAHDAHEAGNLSVAALGSVLAHDSHAIARFNHATKAVAKKPARSHPAPWEVLADVSDVFPSDERIPDRHEHITWRAGHAFRAAMGSQQMQEFFYCRNMHFVRGESHSKAARIRGTPRLELFRDWLSLPFQVDDDVCHALGHIAWEAVGCITQTALLVRYWGDFASGVGDARATEWSYGRHILAAVAYGLCTGVMIPLTDLQAAGLRVEIEAYLAIIQNGANRWKGYVDSSSPCLLPHHMREALRQVEQRRDSVFGYSGSLALLDGLK